MMSTRIVGLSAALRRSAFQPAFGELIVQKSQEQELMSFACGMP